MGVGRVGGVGGRGRGGLSGWRVGNECTRDARCVVCVDDERMSADLPCRCARSNRHRSTRRVRAGVRPACVDVRRIRHRGPRIHTHAGRIQVAAGVLGARSTDVNVDAARVRRRARARTARRVDGCKRVRERLRGALGRNVHCASHCEPSGVGEIRHKVARAQRRGEQGRGYLWGWRWWRR